MQRDNPTRILQTLDARLSGTVDLTLIGKAAMWLGFDNPPEDYGSTMDVDAVVPSEDSAALDNNVEFWKALEQTNDELRSLDLYLTHLFEESQVFLRPDWARHRVRLHQPPLTHIILYRPATLDLILTKMMRGADPGHMAEIQWMIDQDSISRSAMATAIKDARIPEDSDEWQELFNAAKDVVLKMRYADLSQP